MILQLAARNLLRNPRRTVAILLTVALGSSSLLIFDGFNTGIMSMYRENTIHSRYGYGQINTAGYRERVYEKPWEQWMTDWPALKARLEKVPGVNQLFPRVEFFALLTNGRINVSGRGQGIDGAEEARFFTTLNVEEGETLMNQPDGILLGKGLARSLDVKPGDRVTVLTNTVNGSMNGADLTVTGIFHTGIKEFDDTIFRIPMDQAKTLLDTDRVESVALGLRALTDYPKVAEVVKTEFPGLEVTPFAVLDKVYYQHSVDWLDAQFSVTQLIILSIVILGIFNTVSSGILERKQEIGNLRANGESVSDVMRLLISEGAFLGLLGGIIGVAVAWILHLTVLRGGILMPPAPGITRQFHILLELQNTMALKSFALASLTAIIGTVLAAYKVVRMPIGDALRSN